MANYVYKVWCDQDFGQDDVMFASEEIAWEWVGRIIMSEHPDRTFDELVDEYIISVQPLRLLS